MAKMLVTYYSRTGHLAHMAEAVVEGAKTVAGVKVDNLPLEKITARALLNYDAVVIGSPVYYGTMAAPLKALLDESVAFHGQLAGKVGGAFSSSANVGGGNETTILGILQAMLIHGMVIQGSASGDHYGPVGIGAPDARCREECQKLGRNLAALAARLHG
jgi:NAD(P)H dehydrogenase (quinone)